jgi:regulator of protease activity HflC (stomatin/prohibitin superfamily)
MIANGDKQAAILKAEGLREATILEAEGSRQAAILEAEGYALALDKVFEVAKDVDSKTLTLQYLEALKNLGAGASTKFIIPTELLNLAKPLTDLAKGAHQD